MAYRLTLLMTWLSSVTIWRFRYSIVIMATLCSGCSFLHNPHEHIQIDDDYSRILEEGSFCVNDIREQYLSQKLPFRISYLFYVVLDTMPVQKGILQNGSVRLVPYIMGHAEDGHLSGEKWYSCMKEKGINLTLLKKTWRGNDFDNR